MSKIIPSIRIPSAFLASVFILLTAPSLHAQVSESTVKIEMKDLNAAANSASGNTGGRASKTPNVDTSTATTDQQHSAAIAKAAADIATLPPGPAKVKYADNLAHLASSGDPGNDALQAVVDTLSKALAETPQPPGKNGQPAAPYFDLAKFVRYDELNTTLKDPAFLQAAQMLIANDDEIAKADFKLEDLNGKKVTLSSLRGKIVLVNFWATDCKDCLKEMIDLDTIYTHYAAQDLVILSLTEEVQMIVDPVINQMQYHPTVLIDEGGKVAKTFHVDARPRDFVFDRDGKLAAESIGLCTQLELYGLLAKAGLHP
jgi:thiol-disulfide isomerase/thioredoxin